MSDEELSEFLTEQGIGILALAMDGDAYAVPISFGYDESDDERRLYFDLIEFGGDSLKIDYIEETDVACFSTYDVRSQFDWRSAVVFGEIDDVPEADHEHMDEVMNDNAWFPSLFPPSDPMTGVRRCVVTASSATGRRGESRQT